MPLTVMFAHKRLPTCLTIERPLILVCAKVNPQTISSCIFFVTKRATVFGRLLLYPWKFPCEGARVRMVVQNVFLELFLGAKPIENPWTARFGAAEWSFMPVDMLVAPYSGRETFVKVEAEVSWTFVP
jgi:hypothetical protein